MNQTIKQYCACVSSCPVVEGDGDSLKSLNMLIEKFHVFLSNRCLSSGAIFSSPFSLTHIYPKGIHTWNPNS